MDYGFAEKRKTKNDKRAKARFNRYKKGGQQRSSGISLSNSFDKK
jgi:hypothetical protein